MLVAAGRLPGQGVDDGLAERAKGQPGVDGLAAIGLHQSCVFGRNPERHFDERADIVGDQKWLVRPDQRGVDLDGLCTCF